MMRFPKVTDNDRLFASGLLSLIVSFLLLGWNFTHDRGALMIIGLFVAGNIVFSVSPLLRGFQIQRLLAVLFLMPAFAYLCILLKII
jgi:hypothetical protein